MAETIRLNDYYTSDETAKILGVTKARVSQLAINKVIAGIKIAGRVWIIEKKSLREYVEALNRVKGEKNESRKA